MMTTASMKKTCPPLNSCSHCSIMPSPNGARRWRRTRPSPRACGRARPGSRLDDDVAVFDVHRKRLGDIRPLGQRFALLDRYRVGPDLEALRIEPGLAVAHVEF